MHFFELLAKHNNFHDAVITKIIVENPNHIKDDGGTPVKPEFNIQIELEHYQNKKVHKVLIEFNKVHEFKFSKSETYSYLIFGLKLEEIDGMQKVIIDDFDEIICEEIIIH